MLTEQVPLKTVKIIMLGEHKGKHCVEPRLWKTESGIDELIHIQGGPQLVLKIDFGKTT